jgi:hypothetical protein
LRVVGHATSAPSWRWDGERPSRLTEQVRTEHLPFLTSKNGVWTGQQTEEGHAIQVGKVKNEKRYEALKDKGGVEESSGSRVQRLQAVQSSDVRGRSGDG